LAVGFAAFIGWSTAAAALRPLNQVTETALQITRADDLSRRIPLRGPPRDEVGRLILAFNETLERLERVFETQRRFMADVSHELRTPLTVIRGNVDLIRRTGQADSESLEAVVSEVDRMTRMVQDVLLLAQAESGKLPLGRELVELDTLLLEVFQQGCSRGTSGGPSRSGRPGARHRDATVKAVLLNRWRTPWLHAAGGVVTMSLACIRLKRLTIRIPAPEFPRMSSPTSSSVSTGGSSPAAFGGGGAGLGLDRLLDRQDARRRIEVAPEGRGRPSPSGCR
jgi:HAMP domain-containing protein